MESDNDKTKAEVLRCSFCNKSQREVRKLIAGPTTFICDECVDICLDIIAEDRVLETKESAKPAQVLQAALDEHLVGQSAAKIGLSALFSRHHFRISGHGMDLRKSNLLLVGPTGTGKTLAVTVLAKELGLPLAAVDATRLTGASYFKQINVVDALHEQAGRNLDATSKGVVCIEQMDKIAARGQKNDPGLRAQETLLEVLEGGSVEVVNERGNVAKLNTNDILFVGCGTFPGLDARLGSEGIIGFGFLPELAARFSACIGFEALTAKDLTEILTRPNGALRDYLKLFELEGVSLSFTPEALQAIASEAARRQGGVRSLRALLESVALEISSELASRPGTTTYAVDDVFIQNRIRSVEGRR